MIFDFLAGLFGFGQESTQSDSGKTLAEFYSDMADAYEGLAEIVEELHADDGDEDW